MAYSWYIYVVSKKKLNQYHLKHTVAWVNHHSALFRAISNTLPHKTTQLALLTTMGYIASGFELTNMLSIGCFTETHSSHAEEETVAEYKDQQYKNR